MLKLLRLKSILLVLFFSFISAFALLHPGLPPTHDGEYHVIRFYEFNKVLREGILYPRLAPDLNNGFGVPLFNYVYPLPNYMASLFHLFGASFIDSFKLNMFFASLLGSSFFYLWSKRYWGESGGIVSSVFYSFAPYRFLDIYIRGSVGEVWAISLFPGLLWAIDKYIEKPGKRYSIYSVLFLSALIFSHNILGLFFFIFLISYLVMKTIINKVNIVGLLKIIILGLALSSPFWLPALIETKYVLGLEVTNIKDNFPEIYQLIIPSWGSGFSGLGLKDQMSFQIGMANLLIIFLISIGYFFWYRKNKLNIILVFFLLWFYLVLFFLTPYSSWFWAHLPLIRYAQFPWRLLSFEIIIAPFLAGSFFILPFFQKRIRRIFLFIALTFVVFVLGIGYAQPAFYHYRNDQYYLTRSNFIDGTNSIGNQFNTKWLDKIPEKTKNELTFVQNKGEIRLLNKNSTSINFSYKTKEKSIVKTHFSYFPGWIAKVDGKRMSIQNIDGIIGLSLPKGEHRVILQYSETFASKFSYLVFSISLLVLVSEALNVDIIRKVKHLKI